MTTGTPATLIELASRLAEVARGDVGDFVDFGEDGSIRLDLRRAEAEGKLWLIRRLKVERRRGRGGRFEGFELELHDKLHALDLLLRVYRLVGSSAPAAAAPPAFPDLDLAVPRLPSIPRRPAAVAAVA